MTFERLCKCGHRRREHTGTSGPSSLGRSHGGECTHGCTVIAPYRFGGCRCWEFKPRLFPSRIQASSHIERTDHAQAE